MNSVKEILGKHILADGMNLVMNMEKSQGSFIYDDLTDSNYLDMFSMYASSAIGYNHPYLEKHKDWLGKMALNKPALSDVYSKEYAEFMETFERIAIPKELPYAFFISGGTLAVENALKTAFDWKTRFNQQIQKTDVEADIVIHFKQAFHGRSGYTLSLTNTADPRKYLYFPKFNWPRIINPKLKFPLTDDGVKETIKLEDLAKSEIEEAFLQYGNRVACVIIETLQGEGGDNFFRKEFHQYLRKVTEENNALLIYDEVQCGMGITGKMWAYEHYGIIPDVIAFGKKAQVCGILANKEKLDVVQHNVFHESSRINSTFGGNFIDVCRLKLILEVMEKENLVQNANVQGAYLLNKLHILQEEFPNIINNARGLGLWCSFDFKQPENRAEFVQKCFKEKLIILTCGVQSIRFRPHLDVSQNSIDKAIEIIRKVLSS